MKCLPGIERSEINILIQFIWAGEWTENSLVVIAFLFQANHERWGSILQFAGMEAHIVIIGFLKRLSKKYLKEFTLRDEGNYWETGDKKILMKQFSRYEVAMDIFCEALTDLPAIPGETAESLKD